MSMSAQAQPLRTGPAPKAKMSRDDWVMRGYMIAIGIYQIVALALPLYAMLSKAFETSLFELSQFQVQVSDEAGNFNTDPVRLDEINARLGKLSPSDLETSSDGRLDLTQFFPDFSFRSPVKYRLIPSGSDAVYLVGSERFTGPEAREFDSNTFRKVVIRPIQNYGLANFATYFSTPALFQSIQNSLLIAAISTVITVTLAFGFAYALCRSCMPFKGVFRVVAMAG